MLRIKKSKGEDMDVIFKHSQVKSGTLLKYEWILCPVCGNKTRLKMRDDTVLKNFPLFCPKCKQETIINVKQLNISVIKEPDIKMQSR